MELSDDSANQLAFLFADSTDVKAQPSNPVVSPTSDEAPSDFHQLLESASPVITEPEGQVLPVVDTTARTEKHPQADSLVALNNPIEKYNTEPGDSIQVKTTLVQIDPKIDEVVGPMKLPLKVVETDKDLDSEEITPALVREISNRPKSVLAGQNELNGSILVGAVQDRLESIRPSDGEHGVTSDKLTVQGSTPLIEPKLSSQLDTSRNKITPTVQAANQDELKSSDNGSAIQSIDNENQEEYNHRTVLADRLGRESIWQPPSKNVSDLPIKTESDQHPQILKDTTHGLVKPTTATTSGLTPTIVVGNSTSELQLETVSRVKTLSGIRGLSTSVDLSQVNGGEGANTSPELLNKSNASQLPVVDKLTPKTMNIQTSEQLVNGPGVAEPVLPQIRIINAGAENRVDPTFSNIQLSNEPVSGISSKQTQISSVASDRPLLSSVDLYDQKLPAKLGSHITVMADRGVQSAVVQLRPAELGPIHIEISLENERLVVNISAAQAATREMLETSLPRLREQLIPQNYVEVDVNVSDQGRAQGNLQGQGQTLSGQSQSHRSELINNAEEIDNPDPELVDVQDFSENNSTSSYIDAYV